MLVLIVIAAIGGLIFAIYEKNKRKKNIDKNIKFLKSLPGIIPDFRAEKLYLNPEGLSMIAMDSSQRRFIFARMLSAVEIKSFGNKAGLYTHRSLNFRDIIQSEVVVDGKTITSGGVGGAVVGGLLFGVVGAVVGSRAVKTRKDISTISLKVVLNDVNSPSFELPFYNKVVSTAGLEDAQRECQMWHDTLVAAASSIKK